MASTEPVVSPHAAPADVTADAWAAQAQEQAARLPAHLVRVGVSFEQTYRPVLDFAGWKVAMLRHFDVVDPETFHRVERHWNTNEVFLLTVGRAWLILLDDDEGAPAGPGHVVEMTPHVAYDVQQSVWHHVLMSPDAHIVLVERSETGAATTDYAELAPSLRDALLAHCRADAGP